MICDIFHSSSFPKWQVRGNLYESHPFMRAKRYTIRECLVSIRERLRPIQEASIYTSGKLLFTRGLTLDTRENEADTRAIHLCERKDTLYESV